MGQIYLVLADLWGSVILAFIYVINGARSFDGMVRSQLSKLEAPEKENPRLKIIFADL